MHSLEPLKLKALHTFDDNNNKQEGVSKNKQIEIHIYVSASCHIGIGRLSVRLLFFFLFICSCRASLSPAISIYKCINFYIVIVQASFVGSLSTETFKLLENVYIC